MEQDDIEEENLEDEQKSIAGPDYYFRDPEPESEIDPEEDIGYHSGATSTRFLSDNEDEIDEESQNIKQQALLVPARRGSTVKTPRSKAGSVASQKQVHSRNNSTARSQGNESVRSQIVEEENTVNLKSAPKSTRPVAVTTKAEPKIEEDLDQNAIEEEQDYTPDPNRKEFLETESVEGESYPPYQSKGFYWRLLLKTHIAQPQKSAAKKQKLVTELRWRANNCSELLKDFLKDSCLLCL